MTYETVSKVRAADGSLHDSMDAARKHDVERKKYARKERVRSDLTDLVATGLSCADSLAHGWADEPYNHKGRRPTHEDIADFILDQWAAMAAIRQHL